MAAVANNPAIAKKTKIPQSVGKEFLQADKGKKFGMGGSANVTRGGKGMINKQETRGGSTLGYQKEVPNINLNKYVGMKKGGPVLSVGRGEKLPTDKGAGLTAKGRAKYNRETGSNLKAPQPQGGSRKNSFCARMSGVVKHASGDAPRAKASLRR